MYRNEQSFICIRICSPMAEKLMCKETGETKFFTNKVQDNQVAALFLSFLLHALIFFPFIIFASGHMPINEPVVIDLTLVESFHDGLGTAHNTPQQKSKIQRQTLPINPAAAEKKDNKRLTDYTSPDILLSKTEPLPQENNLKLPERKAPDDALSAGFTNLKASMSKEAGTASTTGSAYDRRAVGNASGDGKADAGEGLRGKYLAQHFAYIRDIIKENIIYPRRAKIKGWSGTVLVSFLILENGQVENIRIIKSTGYELLDGNVVETIKAIKYFPKPPIKAQLQIPIDYRLEF